MVDGSSGIYKPINLTASFANSVGNPIINLFLIWSTYASLVFEGDMSPYPDAVSGNWIDYNTRVFRILLDPTGKYVSFIAATGPGMVEAIGIGGMADFNRTTPYNEQQSKVDFSFTFHGVEYQDPVLLWEFNQTCYTHNPALKAPYSNGLFKVPTALRGAFEYYGYPHIDLATNEFEIWVKQADVYKVLTARGGGSIRRDDAELMATSQHNYGTEEVPLYRGDDLFEFSTGTITDNEDITTDVEGIDI